MNTTIERPTEFERSPAVSMDNGMRAHRTANMIYNNLTDFELEKIHMFEKTKLEYRFALPSEIQVLIRRKYEALPIGYEKLHEIEAWQKKYCPYYDKEEDIENFTTFQHAFDRNVLNAHRNGSFTLSLESKTLKKRTRDELE